MRLLLTALMVAAVAACGGSSSASPQHARTAPATGGISSPSASPEAIVDASSPSASVSTAPPTAAPHLAAPRAAVPAAPAPRAPGAQPGGYKVQVSSSRALGATPPQTLSGAYVLEVGPAQATSNGATQEESINLGSGGTFTSDLLFGNDGSVALTRITQTGGGEYPQPPLSPAPPIVVVPAALSAGQAWSGSFTSPVGNGSYTGSLQGPTSTAVGGRTLSVWTVTIHVSVAGTYDGYPYTATVDVRAGWSPDLRLFVSDHMDTHGQLNTLAGLPLFAVQGTLDATLLSATPS